MLYVVELNVCGQIHSLTRATTLREALTKFDIELDDNAITWLLSDLRNGEVCALADTIDEPDASGIFIKEMPNVPKAIAYYKDDKLVIEPIDPAEADSFIDKNKLVDFFVR